MTRCDRCGNDVGALYCSKCRADMESRHKTLVPLLYYDKEHKCYRFACSVTLCPCNELGVCSTRFITIPINILHEYDGDNIIKNYCG